MITIYTDKFIPDEFGAVNMGPLTLVRPKYKDDKALLEHERVHFKQWASLALLGPIAAGVLYLAKIPEAQQYLIAILLVPSLFHGVLYKLVSSYRQRCEVACYKEQLKHYKEDRSELFGGFLASKYDLDIDSNTAVRLLKD